jgi:hypothetical protein
MKGSTVLLLVAAVAYLALSGCPPRQIATVPPGVDCFSTPSERSGTRMADQPLPAGFFAPDSEPFQGDLCFHGDPQIALDTCVQRLDKLEFDANGQASTRIELTELDLVGCEPILVKIGGRDTYWDVRGTVSKAKPTTGRMRVSRTSERGGEFDAEFDFLVRMTFTPRDPELKTVVFDAGALDQLEDPVRREARLQAGQRVHPRSPRRRGRRSCSGVPTRGLTLGSLQPPSRGSRSHRAQALIKAFPRYMTSRPSRRPVQTAGRAGGGSRIVAAGAGLPARAPMPSCQP